MELYYQNETLFVDIETLLNLEDLEELRRRIFRIVEDYDVDHIIIHNKTHQMLNRRFLYQIKQEYTSKYCGRLYIK